MKFMVFGCSGTAGTHASALIGKKHAVVKVARDYPGADYRVDASDIGAVRQVISKEGPDVVLNAVKGKGSIDSAEENKALTWSSSVVVSENLARLQAQHGYLLIQVSSDWVYEGKNNETYTETSLPYPQNFYAFTKLVAEERVRMFAQKYAILRTTGLFGVDERQSNFFLRAKKALESGGKFEAADDQFSQPIYGGEFAKIVLAAAEKGASGIYNADGCDYLSRFELALLFCDAFGWEREKVVAAKSALRSMRIPQYLKVDISKLQKDICKVEPIGSQLKGLKDYLKGAPATSAH